ncbi:hypothetical protein [Mobilicoccus caccae]|uniref:Secretion/DNA translocation related CpaE-like protein n=1 Tax=Mobilicoccus caccae TaxID=1859295 RepID=A0ABQ6INM1_9MICO|nr:hypothetical protein [Mobilicoccus caccae]GMA38309.1 hypothetical protein GCM10025883_03540 [Mobilicoccus caccae]
MTRVISVVGTAGGVGASVLTAALASRASHLGAAVVAVDARPFGGGLDVVLGADEEPGLRWRDLADAAGPVEGAEVFGRLPLAGRCGVLSFDRDEPLIPSPEALTCLVGALGRVSDIVLIDAPRAGEVWEAEVADLSDEVIAVTGYTIPALAAAAASLAHLDLVHDGLWLACRTDRETADLPDAITRRFDIPLLGAVPTDARVPTALREGRPPPGRGRLAKAVDAMLGNLRPLRRAA